MATPTLKVLKRDRFHYNQYRYSLGIRQELASVIRDFKGDYVTDRARAERQFNWRAEMARKFRGIDEVLSEERRWPVYSLLETFCDRIQEHGRDFKVVIGFGQLHIYANDLEWLSEIAEHYPVFECTQIDLVYPPDTVALARPTGFKFRTYLKQKTLSIENAGYLRNWIKNQENLRLSPGLHVWVNHNWSDTSGGYFFEHNDQRLISMLNITVPNIIKNTKTIIVVDK